jgi:hypothetical protein
LTPRRSSKHYPRGLSDGVAGDPTVTGRSENQWQRDQLEHGVDYDRAAILLCGVAGKGRAGGPCTRPAGTTVTHGHSSQACDKVFRHEYGMPLYAKNGRHRMITIRRAVVDDAQAISALLMVNGVEQGGALYGEWSIGVVIGWIKSDALIVVATRGSRPIGVLFTSEKAQASAPASTRYVEGLARPRRRLHLWSGLRRSAHAWNRSPGGSLGGGCQTIAR